MWSRVKEFVGSKPVVPPPTNGWYPPTPIVMDTQQFMPQTDSGIVSANTAQLQMSSQMIASNTVLPTAQTEDHQGLANMVRQSADFAQSTLNFWNVPPMTAMPIPAKGYSSAPNQQISLTTNFSQMPGSSAPYEDLRIQGSQKLLQY